MNIKLEHGRARIDITKVNSDYIVILFDQNNELHHYNTKDADRVLKQLAAFYTHTQNTDIKVEVC